eukprot:4229461-Prymnesium_polylepis.1
MDAARTARRTTSTGAARGRGRSRTWTVWHLRGAARVALRVRNRGGTRRANEGGQEWKATVCDATGT